MATRTTGRTRLLVFWDFQNSGATANRARGVSDRIKAVLETRFASISYRRFKAFGGTNQSQALRGLSETDWRCWEDDGNMDEELISQARSDCGQAPGETILVLIVMDRDYVGMIQELQEQGVDVYLGRIDQPASNRLQNAVGAGHVIDLR